jgi:hypothetical protein
MQQRFVSYLRDNRDQIIENWLTEAELPAPQESRASAASGTAEGIVPYAFFGEAFDGVVRIIESGDCDSARLGSPQLGQFLGRTCECRSRTFGGRICMELHDSGLSAFLSVFSEDWDVAHEFSALDREHCAERINHALSGFFGREVEECPHKESRHDCPFSAYIPNYQS